MSAYGLSANNVPATIELELDTPSWRMHQLAVQPLSTIISAQERLIAVKASGTTRLTAQTIN